MVAGSTEVISVGPGGAFGDYGGDYPWISATGRYVGFVSAADNLVPNDTNGVEDSFLRDRVLGLTERVSTGPGGSEANGQSGPCVVSNDGRYAFFGSVATNLVPGVTAGLQQVYRKDRRTGAIDCLSLNTFGVAGNGNCSRDPSISNDGRYVVFTSTASDMVGQDYNMVSDVFLRDCVLGSTIRVSSGQMGQYVRGASERPWISSTGRYVSFVSASRALTPPDTNGVADVFLWNRGY
jgi:Tol biopolymer transport system component